LNCGRGQLCCLELSEYSEYYPQMKPFHTFANTSVLYPKRAHSRQQQQPSSTMPHNRTRSARTATASSSAAAASAASPEPEESSDPESDAESQAASTYSLPSARRVEPVRSGAPNSLRSSRLQAPPPRTSSSSTGRPGGSSSTCATSLSASARPRPPHLARTFRNQLLTPALSRCVSPAQTSWARDATPWLRAGAPALPSRSTSALPGATAPRTALAWARSGRGREEAQPPRRVSHAALPGRQLCRLQWHSFLRQGCVQEHPDENAPGCGGGSGRHGGRGG